jgi:2-succinyl-6-hydroxy-2,4-cyclohexadiene-1-carboxylate synthase
VAVAPSIRSVREPTTVALDAVLVDSEQDFVRRRGVSVVLLHGFAGTPAAWDEVIARWRGPAPTAIALPGHGGDPVGARWDDNLDRVAARVPPRSMVVGYSLGARVALGLLARDAIEAAVLIGVNPGIDDDERPARRASDAAWAAMLRERGIAAFASAWQAQPLFATQARASEAARDERRRRRLALDPEQLARSLETMGLAEMPDYRGALIARAARAHLVVGADDAAYVARARALAGVAPFAVDEIAASGHDPTLEQPAALAAVVCDALARWSDRLESSSES